MSHLAYSNAALIGERRSLLGRKVVVVALWLFFSRTGYGVVSASDDSFPDDSLCPVSRRGYERGTVVCALGL